MRTAAILRRRLTLTVAAVVCLLLASGAAADPVNTFTAAGAPSLVKPATSASYTITLTNDSLSPDRAQRAKIGIPAGFTVDPVSVQATTTPVAGSCDASTWEADGSLIADQKINLKRPAGDSSSLCQGASLTIGFLALSAATDGTSAWASELLNDVASFTLSGSNPVVVVDGTAPDVTITQKPNDPSNESSPSFSFTSGESGSTFACKLDSEAFASCPSPKSYIDLADGSHTFVVEAADAAGNSGQASHSWTIDTNPPTATITDKPSDPSNDTSPTFAFTKSEPGNLACKLDGGSFAPCDSPKTYTDLADGSHTLAVHATDAAGNTGSDDTYTWTVDATAPATTITEKPNDPSNDASPTFSFTAVESVQFQCKLGGADFAPCTSPKTYPGLAGGLHTFAVKATDAAGNTGAATTHGWTIDTTGPTASITQKPSDPDNDSSPSFVFTASEPGGLECKLDDAAFADCASPQTYNGIADGPHTFSVKATDAAGNTGTAATHTWTIDTVAPTAAIDVKPELLSNDSSSTFSFTAGQSGSSFLCKLDGAAFATCTPPKDYADLPDGSHTFVVKATDPAGNTGPETSHTWTIDTVAPTATITERPNNPSNESSPSFTFTASESGSTFACKRDADLFATCSSPKSYALADGSHTFVVRASDPAGNTGPETTYGWTIDTAAPATAITQKPDDPTNDDPSFTFTSQAGSTFACKLDAAAFAPCASPKSYTGLADGSHTFAVKATDPAGNAGPETTYTWTIDTAAPTVTITQKPNAASNEKSPSFAFTAGESSTFQCKLDEAAFASCGSPKGHVDLADGAHAFSVKATDAAGNTGLETSYAWTIDTVAPTTAITGNPNDPSNDTSPSFAFGANEPAELECKLDAAAFAPCTSPKTFAGVAAGTHTLAVKAADAAGNTGDATTYTWTIDTTAPTTSISQKPQDPSNSTSPSFTFTAGESGSQFSCKLDAEAFAPCTSPKIYTGLAEGSHTFAVRATDAAANTGADESHTWTIDTTAPAAAITQKPDDPSRNDSPSFTFTAGEAGSTFACKLNQGSFAPCISAKSYAGLADGAHTFAVRATDAAGNPGLETSYAWTIDTIAPTAGITNPPADPSNNTAPSFTLTASQAGSTFACKLDAAAFAPCTSPKSYAGLTDGSHTFVVEATDPAGNTSTATSLTWTIDTVAPTASITDKPSDPHNSTAPSFTFTASQAGSTFACKLDAAAFAPCTSPKSYAGLSEASHTFVVMATDAAGNPSAEASYTWTIDVAAPTATITEKPGDPSNNAAPSFTLTASQIGSTFVCKLDTAAFAPCPSPKSYAGLAQGTHTFAVKAIDPAGNASAETDYTWTIDTTAPTTTITGKPNDRSNNTSPNFVFASSEGGSTLVCKLGVAAFAPCVSPKNHGTLTPGEHTFRVKATDAAGNAGPETSHTWTIDIVAPTAAIDGKPADPSNNSSPSFLFSASESSTFSCRLDGESFACTSPTSHSTLSEGSHTFTVKATDAAGNPSPEMSYTWTIDTIAPTTAISGKPNNPSNNSSPSFSFTSNEGGSSFSCELDAAAFAPCVSPTNHSNLTQGQHTFAVTATDAAGNSSEASYSWMIDTTPPVATITQGPSHPSNNKSPRFMFTSSEPNSSFTCRIEQGGFEPCSSPKDYSALLDGEHTFAVRATDAANNTGSAFVTAWTIDTVAPITTISAKPGNPSNNSAPSFTFNSDVGSSIVCSLDGSPFAACASPIAYSGLADGLHTFTARATDPAGNTGPENVYSWRIETRAPTAALISAPGGLSNGSFATFSFSADEPASFDCKLDGRGFEACSSPASYHGLADGPHAFSVRAQDGVGNFSTAVSHVWTIDTTAPETTLGSTPKAKTPTASASFSFTASEGGTFECRLDGVPFALCASPKSYASLGKGEHRFEVRAIDAAGNADATPAVHSWTIEAAARKAAASALLTPRTGARVTKPPLLAWRRVARARYYNVQLFRGRVKIFTAWPTRTRLQLRARWKFQGRKRQLKPGAYRWYVWPGYGAPSARRYGTVLGQSSFTVVRPKSRR